MRSQKSRESLVKNFRISTRLSLLVGLALTIFAAALVYLAAAGIGLGGLWLLTAVAQLGKVA